MARKGEGIAGFLSVVAILGLVFGFLAAAIIAFQSTQETCVDLGPQFGRVCDESSDGGQIAAAIAIAFYAVFTWALLRGLALTLENTIWMRDQMLRGTGMSPATEQSSIPSGPGTVSIPAPPSGSGEHRVYVDSVGADRGRLARAIAIVTGEDEDAVSARLRNTTPVLVGERLDDDTASRLYVAIRQNGGSGRKL